MSEINNREKLKEYFETGKLPTEDQFAELIESFVHTHHEADQKVGLGTDSPQNVLDVNGSVVIGNQFAGQRFAPVDGLLVEGNVGIGTEDPPEEQLQVSGNLRIDSGGLKIGSKTIIDHEGKWNGDPAGLKGDKGDDGEKGEPGTTSWNDGTGKVTTDVKVGIGVNNPSHALEVDGFVSRQHVGFTVDGIQKVEKGGKVIPKNIVSNISKGWIEDEGVFAVPQAGVYSLSAVAYLSEQSSGRIAIVSETDSQELVMVWEEELRSGMGAANLVIFLNKGDKVALRFFVSQANSKHLLSINFSGYRL